MFHLTSISHEQGPYCIYKSNGGRTTETRHAGHQEVTPPKRGGSLKYQITLITAVKLQYTSVTWYLKAVLTTKP